MNLAMDLQTRDLTPPAVDVVLIGPDRGKRSAIAAALRRLGVRIHSELAEYPDSSMTTALSEVDCGAFVIDLDTNTTAALEFVESLCASSKTATPMVYSSSGDPSLLVSCMRAGARELILLPVADEALAAAVSRAAGRRGFQEPRRRTSKLFFFLPAKGGAGASTLAANFAVSLAQESSSQVALLDLHDELGDLSVLLNLTPRFSLLDALLNPDRLDWDFLSGLMVEHKSGVHLLAAPDEPVLRRNSFPEAGVEKIFRLLQENYPFVVVDAGALHMLPLSILKDADAVYIVTQVDIPSLRNSQRLAAHLSVEIGQRAGVQIIVNRFDARNSSIKPAEIDNALTFPVPWRIPNDYAAVNNAANTGIALATQSSAVSKTLRRMAQAAIGKPETKPKSSTWRLFRGRA